MECIFGIGDDARSRKKNERNDLWKDSSEYLTFIEIIIWNLLGLLYFNFRVYLLLMEFCYRTMAVFVYELLRKNWTWLF